MITIIVGTNRKKSVSKQISLIYHELLTSRKVESRVVDLENLPDNFVYTALYEHEGKNDDFNYYRKIIEDSQKFVFVVPEYNGSFPGVLKAFIDGMDHKKSFAEKKGALIGLSSGGMGAGLALSHLTDILNYMGMHVLAYKPRFPNIENSMTDYRFVNKSFVNRLEKQVEMLINF